MLRNIFKPMYKTRNYQKIVTIDSNGKVEYKKTELEEQFSDHKNSEILPNYEEIYDALQKAKKEMLAAVDAFVTNTNAKLKCYKDTYGDLIAKIWEYSQAFQDARVKYKQDLETVENDLSDALKDGIKETKQVIAGGQSGQTKETVEQVYDSVKKLKSQIKIIKSNLLGLKLMNFEMKSILSSKFGLMTEKTINNAIASFVVIYNRIFDQIKKSGKQENTSFKDKLTNMVINMRDHVYFGRSMKHRISDARTKNGLQFWIDKIKAINDTNELKIKDFDKDKIPDFESGVKTVSDKLLEKQKSLLEDLKTDDSLTGEIARKKLTEFLNTAKKTMEELNDFDGVPGELLLAAKFKICADLLKAREDEPTVWTVFGRAKRGALSVAEGFRVAGNAVPKLTKIAVACSVLGTVCSTGFVALCVVSIFTAGIPLVLAGFGITISSLISITAGNGIGLGMVSVGDCVEREARLPAKEFLGTTGDYNQS